MTAKTSLFYEAITGEDRKALKAEKKKALLEQQNNIYEYKQKLGAYKAKMGASGIADISNGVAKGYAQTANNKNNLITQDLNEKIIENRNKRRKKTLLSLGFKNLT